MTTYRVLVCEVGQPPRVEETPSPFTRCKALCDDGYIQIQALDEGVLLFCDEEGGPAYGQAPKWPFNRNVPATARLTAGGLEPGEVGVHRVYGTFVIGRHDYTRDVPVSLSDEDIAKYTTILGGRP